MILGANYVIKLQKSACVKNFNQKDVNFVLFFLQTQPKKC